MLVSKLHKELCDIGFKPSTYEPALFCLVCSKTENLCGILVSLVDDLLMAFDGESEHAQTVRSVLGERFTFGSWDMRDVVCCGCYFHQDEHFEVHIDITSQR